MAGGRHSRRVEAATSSTEYVGLAVAIAVLVAAFGTGAAGSGGSIGDAVGSRVEQLVEAPTSEGRRRGARERRWQGGDEPQRVARDTLRMTPVIDAIAAWQQHWAGDARLAGVDARIDARACALCVALEWSHELGSGSQVDRDGAHVGLEATLAGAARIALASADATVRARRALGPARASAHARARATVGAEADAELRARLSRHEQELQLGGTAMAGAVARAEGRFGVELLGVAISQSGRAEGWAGAGARGAIGMHRTSEKVEWRLGWGAALGLGGATEWSGSIDISAVPRRHRRIARASLAAAMRATPIGLPLLLPFTTSSYPARTGGSDADHR